MKHWKKVVFITAVIAGLVAACSGGSASPEAATGIPQDAAAIATQRGLTPADITAALKTYTPSGQTDPYIMFASGGQGGQVLVIGVPSMRILRLIGVFSPESLPTADSLTGPYLALLGPASRGVTGQRFRAQA